MMASARQDQQQLQRARIVASVAATFISLACGTNYVYSAWAPQFAERLKLSSTESNLIGLFGNLGMYSVGVPTGMVIDAQGPRPAVVVGSILLAIGYFPLHQAYDKGSGSVALCCFYSFLTGFGGCMAFSAAIKTSALNWPSHRGTATAFPLAAFGLSAFFFSLVGSLLFPGDPSAFLMLLSWGTSGMAFISFFFLKVYPVAPYRAVATEDTPQQLHRTSSEEAKRRSAPHGTDADSDEPGTLPFAGGAGGAVAESAVVTSNFPEFQRGPAGAVGDVEDSAMDETSSLVSGIGLDGEGVSSGLVDVDRSHQVDIRGLTLLRTLSFWQLWSIMSILAGIGLMTINNIGNDAKALWMFYDDTKDEEFLVKRQQMHVSILSIGSFIGRFLSGVGSDYLVKRLHATRIWCLVIACVIFIFAQICGLNIANPNYLGLVSSLSGLGYGFLFGVFPSIVAETFGIRGMTQNWGFMTLAPVPSSNIFNLFYGSIFDKHSVVGPGGERFCHEGLQCYRSAYVVTLVAGVIGVVVTLWVIRHQHLRRMREARKGDEED